VCRQNSNLSAALPEKSSSLCKLCVLCVSVVDIP
jgi:hypothetical protein